MLRRTLLHVIGLVLTATTLVFTVEAAFAQKKPVVRSAKSPYLQMRSTTDAQRRAAALANWQRKAAAGQKNQVGLNASKGVKK